MAKVCIIEDDKKINEELSIFLTKNGYEVISIEDFENIIEPVLQKAPDIILLDINLPKLDGYYICKEIRKKSNIPIIIVTSRNTEIDELMSMNIGADDFVSKPYNTQILLARIEAVLKRVDGSNIKNILEYKGVKVDIFKSNLIFNNLVVELTKNELKLLSYFIKNKGRIVAREEIMSYLWDSEMYVDDNTLTVNMNRLRKKLEDLGVYNFIETKRGQGYITL